MSHLVRTPDFWLAIENVLKELERGAGCRYRILQVHVQEKEEKDQKAEDDSGNRRSRKENEGEGVLERYQKIRRKNVHCNTFTKCSPEDIKEL